MHGEAISPKLDITVVIGHTWKSALQFLDEICKNQPEEVEIRSMGYLRMKDGRIFRAMIGSDEWDVVALEGLWAKVKFVGDIARIHPRVIESARIMVERFEQREQELSG